MQVSGTAAANVGVGTRMVDFYKSLAAHRPDAWRPVLFFLTWPLSKAAKVIAAWRS